MVELGVEMGGIRIWAVSVVWGRCDDSLSWSGLSVGMHLVRGNHESKNMNRIYGFEGEVKHKVRRVAGEALHASTCQHQT